ncbi:MAG TPA: hypothetical protein VF855_01505 [Acidimicrobiales bacterium]
MRWVATGTLWLQQRDGCTETRRAIVAASHATHATSVLARTFAGSPQLGATRSFPVTLPLGQIVEGLNAFDPTDLMSYTSVLQRLGHEKRRGELRISPASVMCAGEPRGVVRLERRNLARTDEARLGPSRLSAELGLLE